MPRYYCDYCDTYLTHDSPSVRKQHGAGYKHKANVRTYYQQFEEEQTQSLIDQRIKAHLGQTATFQQIGAAYSHHLASFPQRPRLPILPTPGMPLPGQVPGVAPVPPGMRPPVLPRPMMGAPGYGFAPMMPPQMVAPPGAPSMPMQGGNGFLRPPMMNAPPTPMSAGSSTPTSNGAPSMAAPAGYQTNPTAPTSGGFDSYNSNAAPDAQRPPSAIKVEQGFVAAIKVEPGFQET